MKTLAALFLLACSVFAQDIKIKTPRGAELHATLHTAKKPNGTAVLIAPGQGYHKDLPLIVRSARASPRRAL